MTHDFGDAIGAYTILGAIGEGGMGVVLRGRHISPEKAARQAGDVAIEDGTHPARAQLEPNALGLYDMTANVWEWCWDWHADYPASATDPVGPPTGTERVYRGGGFDEPERYQRVANRGYFLPDRTHPAWGLRLARTATE